MGDQVLQQSLAIVTLAILIQVRELRRPLRIACVEVPAQKLFHLLVTRIERSQGAPAHPLTRPVRSGSSQEKGEQRFVFVHALSGLQYDVAWIFSSCAGGGPSAWTEVVLATTCRRTPALCSKVERCRSRDNR